MGFNVAFGLTAFDGSKEITEDPDYATVVAQYREWGWDENDASARRKALPFHPC